MSARRAALSWAAGAATVACAGPQRVLAPASETSSALAELFWALLLLTGIPAALVIGLALAAALRRRGAAGEPRSPSSEDRRTSAFVVVAGAVVPAGVLLVILGLALRTGHAVARATGPAALTIEVIGHQFWWEVRYPDQGVVTANEIHLPTGTSVAVRVSSADVIHSFWVPALHGKLDMIPGRVNEYRLETPLPGVYRGQCAEFCGVQHARMAMLVIAESRADFDAWAASRSRPRPPLTSERLRRGALVFQAAGCNLCHAVRGHFEHPEGASGPDLTHLAGRRTLAAVTLDNSPDELRAFVRNPHAVKEGVLMPPSPRLSDQELGLLVDYLLLEKGGAP